MPIIRTALILLLSGAVTFAGQSVPTRTPEVLQEAWQIAVDTHVPGQIDEPLRTIAAWSFDEIVAAAQRTPLYDSRLARALALHTDLAIAQRGLQRPAEERPGGRRVVRDGRDDGRAPSGWQWEVARQLIRLPAAVRETLDPERETPGDLDRDAIVRAWFDATCALFLAWADYAELSRQLDAARPWRERHPELLLYEGTLHQAYADARVQAFSGQGRRGGSKPNELETRVYRRSGIGVDDPSSTPEERQAHPAEAGTQADASRERKRAEALFREALARDARLHEARIRLAHVLIDQGRHDAAAPLLREALTASLPPFLEYYGALLLGRLDERRGDLAAARGRFERAGRLYPSAQAPRMALSRLALLEGRLAEALAFLAAGGGDAPAPPHDPWWLHLRLRAPDAEARLASFLAGARR
jgi:tetratricopeptide (TPR) repeat protein